MSSHWPIRKRGTLLPLGLAALSMGPSCAPQSATDAQQKAIIVTRSGTGIGTVSTQGGEIACGTDCTRLYAPGTSVTLTASPDAASTFAGWSGPCTGVSPTCEIKLSSDPNDAKTVTVDAKFDTQYVPPEVTLTVAKTGAGTGKITSADNAIDCGSKCQAQVRIPGTVVLTAAADIGSGFAGWSGACDAQGTDPVCEVQVNLATTVTAAFDKRICSPDNVCWENPLPTGVNLTAIWGKTKTDAWAVGDNGAVLHYDGTAWSATPSGITQKLNAVFGFAANDVWAAGNGGTVIRWDGTKWSSVNSGTTSNLRGVWGADNKNIYFVGQAATLRKWDGTAFTPITVPAAIAGRDLNAIHGLTATNIRVTGELGALIRWDGTAWNVENCGSSRNQFAVFNADATHAYVAGYLGSSSWNGTTWAFRQLASPLTFYSIWASGIEDVWIGAQGGLFLRYHRDAKMNLVWEGVQSPIKTALNGIWGTAANDVWAISDQGGMIHFDGMAWSAGKSGLQAGWNGVWATGGSDMWAVGGGGTIAHWDGGGLSQVDSGTTSTLYGVSGTSASSAWAVGENGTIVRWNGSKWSPTPSGTPVNLYAAAAVGAQDAWAVGAGGKALRWNGSTWNSVSTPTSSSLNVIWAASATDVWAAGDNGTVLRWDGSKWNPLAGPSTMNVLGLWAGSTSNVWAVGPGGVYKYDGSTWTKQTVPSAGPFVGVWGFASGIVYVVGNSGQLLRYDGTTWKALQSGTTGNLTRVYGSSPTNMFLFGDGGALLRTGQ